MTTFKDTQDISVNSAIGILSDFNSVLISSCGGMIERVTVSRLIESLKLEDKSAKFCFSSNYGNGAQISWGFLGFYGFIILERDFEFNKSSMSYEYIL